MFMIDHKDIGWWYWLVTVGLLTYGVAVDSSGFIAAVGFTIFQLIHFIIREKNIAAFPVQVRFWYLMLLIAALPAPVQVIYWIPVIGTWARVIFGYCTMARCVSLFPWNRNVPMSIALLRKTFLSRPVKGNILHGLAAVE